MKPNYAKLYTLRKDGRYQGSWKDETGKRHFMCDKDPEVLYNRLTEKETPKLITFAEIAANWERMARETLTVRTWRSYEPHYKDIVAEHGGKAPSDVTAADIIRDLECAKSRGYSLTVIKTRKAIYSQILNEALAKGLIQFNPAVSVRNPRGVKAGKRRAPTRAQRNVVLHSLSAPFGFFPFFLLCTGLRKSEALALTKADIHFGDTPYISVTKSLEYISNSNPSVKSPKTDAGVRSVPIIPSLRQPLLDHMNSTNSDLLFPAPASNKKKLAGGYISEHAYEGMWRRYCAAVGLSDEAGNPTITAHCLRHGTATILYELGVDAYVAKDILGHSSITVTLGIYAELQAEHREDELIKFSAGMEKIISDGAERGIY